MAGYYVPESMDYFHSVYETCTGKADLYYLFLEKSLRLITPGGRIGMIVPSKFFHTAAAKQSAPCWSRVAGFRRSSTLALLEFSRTGEMLLLHTDPLHRH